MLREEFMQHLQADFAVVDLEHGLLDRQRELFGLLSEAMPSNVLKASEFGLAAGHAPIHGKPVKAAPGSGCFI